MPLPFQFANVATLATPQLDANYNALGALTPIPCVAGGTNALTMTPEPSTPTVASYSNYMQFTGVAANTNTGPGTAAVGSAASLPIFKDTPSGPVALTGGEIIATCAFGLIYDSALNSGNGGFHLMAPSQNLTAPNGTVSTAVVFAGNVHFGAASSTSLVNVVSASASIAWPNIPANSATISTITVPGASVGDCVFVGATASVPTGINFFGWVSTLSTVTLQAYNNTASSITPVAGTYRVAAHRYT